MDGRIVQDTINDRHVRNVVTRPREAVPREVALT
jgi:hypothetical protein